MCVSNKQQYVSPLKKNPNKTERRPTNAYAKQESACHLWSHINSKSCWIQDSETKLLLLEL